MPKAPHKPRKPLPKSPPTPTPSEPPGWLTMRLEPRDEARLVALEASWELPRTHIVRRLLREAVPEVGGRD